MRTINESFSCIECGKNIPPAAKTCRNHCPHCFASLHVDGDIPGDRNTQCHGRMYPIAYVFANGGLKIHFRCVKCGKFHRNKRADEDEVAQLDAYIAQYRDRFIHTPDYVT